MKRNYFVFVQALFLTIVVFAVAFYIGVSVEGSQLNQVNNYYTQSEVSLVDILALNNIISSKTALCPTLVNSNKELLDKVYSEATTLSELEQSNQLTDYLQNLHTKYDILRTYLWINAINIKKECPSSNFSTIVYLYKYNQTDLTKKAQQNVWSRLLLDVKNEDNNVMLIPIAEDSNLTSLQTLIEPYNLTSFPAVIVNGINRGKVFYRIPNKEDILTLINQSQTQQS
jgi:hypothetical protein